jgi:hypothetical protein
MNLAGLALKSLNLEWIASINPVGLIVYGLLILIAVLTLMWLMHEIQKDSG